ncbi:MAG: hypothetical protein QUT30_17915, partial [Acidobacteriota bacterium]|nr:hypothetical protein [Acidobacteriota bacterium]
PPKELLGARPSRPQKSRRDSGAPVSSLRIGSTIGGLDAERAAQPAPPLSGLASMAPTTQVSRASLRSALSPWAALLRAFRAEAVLRIHCSDAE